MNLGLGGLISLGGGSSSSGGGSSGIQIINPGNNPGPTVEFVGSNGVEVTSPSPNVILIDGAGASGAAGGVSKFSATFSNITSGLFTHSLNTLDVIVQVWDGPGGGAKLVLVDEIIVEDPDHISLRFNRPFSGKVVII